MWPFTGRRIFANRWWALAFAAYVCWQAADIAESASGADNSAQAQDNLSQAMQAQAIGDALANIG